MVGLYLGAELHREGSAPAAWAAGMFFNMDLYGFAYNSAVTWNVCHKAMIVRRNLFVCCMLRNELKQYGSMYLRLQSKRPSYDTTQFQI